MDWQKLFADLDDGRQQLDQHVEQQCYVAKEQNIGIFCVKGCFQCCSLAVNCCYSEALALAQNLNSTQRQSVYNKIPQLTQISQQAQDLKQFLQLFRDQLNGCPLLTIEDGSCSAYPQRPFSCRALISTRNSSWCGVDFSTLHPLEKEAFLSSLDPEVVAFPTHYLAAPQELALEQETLAAVTMRKAFGVSLTGNLIYQLWLELEYRFSEVITAGFAATQDFLQQEQLDLPFLLQLHGD